jgi:phospholipase C
VSTQRVQLINPDSNYKDKTFPVDVKLYPCFEHQTLSDLLEANNKTWKYYTNNYGDIWTAPNGINHICVAQGGSTGQPCANPDFTSHVLNSPKQVLSDIASPACALQNMSWVIPNGTWSDHPGLAKGKPSTTIEGGPNWVASIINTLGASTCTDTINGNPVPYWQDTAIIVVWDDWGGFYDHIAPFKVQTGTKGSCDTWGCGYTYGFRVPLLVVSAYTPASYVSGDTRTQGENFPYVHDFGSILGFVENNFGIPIGSINVQEGYPFADAFAPDYSAQPLNVPLADFFSLTSPRQFEQIQTGANSFNLNYFLNYSGPPVDPDNDVIDND